MSRIKNLFLFLIALQILNMGLFAQDISIFSFSQFNRINSVTEYIAEVTLGIKDAFPEGQHQNKSDKKSRHASFHSKNLQFNLYKSNSSYFTISSDPSLIITFHGSLLEKKFQNFVTETTSPPPKQLV